MHELKIKGFKHQEDIREFLLWFQAQGYLDLEDWLKYRKGETICTAESMNLIGKTIWNDTQVKVKVKVPVDINF